MSRVVVYERKTPATRQWVITDVQVGADLDEKEFHENNPKVSADIRATVVDISPSGEVVKGKAVTIYASS